MTTVLRVKMNDLSNQFFLDLGQNISSTSEIEIRIPKNKQKIELFTETEFWQLIAGLDWSKQDTSEIIAPVVQKLSKMPLVNIYLFEDKLSEKLFQLDTRQHGNAYIENEGDDYFSVDDFLYVRCAVVAEGKVYFEKIINKPSELPTDLTFESLLNIASLAYTLKTGREFEYHSTQNYETYSNKKGWKIA
jgi:hypothetical protein